MKHPMRLDPKPFEMIKSGKKKIELRLYDEKRQKIKIGDEILFVNTENGEKLLTRVIELHVFPSFEALYRSLPLLSCGYTEETIKNASPKDMEAFYSPERQNKYGVVGIEIKRIK